MQEIVALVDGQVAAALFEGTEAGVVELPGGGIFGQERSGEGDDGARVVAHDGEEMLLLLGCAFEAGDAVAGRTIGDVLVNRFAGEIEAAQEILGFGRE